MPNSLGPILIDIAIVLFFIALGGVFVAAEIALISLRDSQVRQLASRGKRGAKVAELAKNPNRFLAAVQVGVTFCGFLSAALGAERLGIFLEPRLREWGVSDKYSATLSLILLTIAISYVSLIFGELVPKRLALHRTEFLALSSAATVDRLARIFRPVIWLLSHSTNVVLRAFGIDPKSKRSDISEEELLDLVSGHEALTEEERDIVEEVFNASEKQIHEIMVPRIEVDFLDASLPISQAIRVAVEKSHSRYPVIRGASDEVIGFIHVRDLLDPQYHGDDKTVINKTIMECVRNVLFLPGTKGVLPALTEMRAQRQQIAIVLDEYGGTDGIVTLEDLVECLIGEIHDEYDVQQVDVSPQQRTGDYEVDGLISLDDLQDETGVAIPEGPYETLSGYVMHILGRIPREHDVVRINGFRITVLTLDGKRAGQLLISNDQQSSGKITS